MSHVATVDLEVKDLDALDQACKRLGLVLRRGQKKYKWYGHHVGDYPVPTGFTVEDLGKCEHAIADPENRHAYEIGIVQRRDGKPGFTLLWDFFNEAKGLQAKVGESCNDLRQAYSIEVARKHALKNGYRVQELKQVNGSVKLLMSK